MKTFWLRQVPVEGWAFGRFLGLVGLAGLFFLGGCEYELPAQPTIFVTKKTPDNLGELLKNPASHQGHIAVLGGQILRRVDTPVGRYFLVRDLPLGENSYPMPAPPIRIRKPPVDTAFVLFAPSLKMIGGTKPVQTRKRALLSCSVDITTRRRLSGPDISSPPSAKFGAGSRFPATGPGHITCCL